MPAVTLPGSRFPLARENAASGARLEQALTLAVDEGQLNYALSLVSGLRPKDEIEA